jgi:cytochrome c5
MKRTLVATASVVLLGGQAHADLRSFTETYEYSTVPKGKTALELWHTQGRTTWDADSPQTFEQILEVEHGLTDKWDIAFYSVFEQVSGDATTAEPFHFAELKLETRYRLADRGEWPLDTLLYLETAKEFGESKYDVEGKVIVARDFGKATAAVNAIAEIQFGKNVPETELELGFAAGVTYQVHSKLRLGAETYGTYEEEEFALAAGPAISFAPSASFWIAITAAFGVTDEADAFRARMIMGTRRALAIGLVTMAACARSLPPNATATDAQRARVELAELQQGRQLLIRKCGNCHQTPLPSQHTAADWPGKLDEMADRANLDALQRRVIGQYLVVMAERPPALP